MRMINLHSLSVRLVETPTLVQAPPSAATRITHSPFTSMLKAKWNQEVENLFTGAANLDQRALEVGKKLMYGQDAPTRDSDAPADEQRRS
ncbi:hypothetical protein H0H92_011857 [Tricholoma furcatifolium]|nr:hypothetical protein H0H92_011857 [Tricholoma furcatifolium]